MLGACLLFGRPSCLGVIQWQVILVQAPTSQCLFHSIWVGFVSFTITSKCSPPHLAGTLVQASLFKRHGQGLGVAHVRVQAA